MNRRIVVFGATGRQGGAVARRLLYAGWQVRAITRDPSGPAAQSLRRLGVEVVEASLDARASLDRAVDGAYGVFGVTDFWEHGYDAEVRQGKTLIDAALAAGVQHFVFNSVGGAERTEGLGITHFDSKRAIEQYLRSTPLPFTIFRPVTFFENFTTPRFRRAVCIDSVFRFAIYPTKPFQMVTMDDVGAFVAKAFDDPARYTGAATELASDAFTMLDLVAALSAAIGQPVRYQRLPVWLQRMIATYAKLTHTMGYYKIGPSLVEQFRWNNASETGGWNADLPALRKIYPGLMSLSAWARSVDWHEGIARPELAR